MYRYYCIVNIRNGFIPKIPIESHLERVISEETSGHRIEHHHTQL